MVKTMKQDIAKAIQFSKTFRFIDDLFSINNVNFGNCISAIYPSELELKDTSTSSTEVRYLDTNIKTLHPGLSTFLIWTATFPPIQLTVFTYLNW